MSWIALAAAGYIVIGSLTAWQMVRRFPLEAQDDDTVLSWLLFWPLWVWFLTYTNKHNDDKDAA